MGELKFKGIQPNQVIVSDGVGEEVTADEINSESATAGQVLMADGSGGASWQTPSSGMENPMTTEGDIIVGGSSGTPARLGIGSAGKLLASTGSALAYTDSLPYLTTAPSADNADGLKIVVLDEEPATYYDGYYYIITEANQ